MSMLKPKIVSNGKEKSVLLVAVKDVLQGENPRQEIDPISMAELMQSMKHQGLLSPIGVRILSTGKYQVVFGHRRLMAAARLGWDTIEALVIDVEDEKDALLKTSTENVIRENISLPEQGRTFSVLLKKGLTADQIAVRMGCAKAFVLKALDAYGHIPKKFHDRITFGTRGQTEKKGSIPATVALAVVDIRKQNKLSEAQAEKLMEWAARTGVNVVKTRTAGHMIASGMPPAEAMEKVEYMKTITLSFSLEISKIQKLQKRFGMSIHDICYTWLEQNEALGIRANATKKRADEVPSGLLVKKHPVKRRVR